MTADETRGFFVRHAAAWNGQNVAALVEDYTEDATVVSPMLGTIQGRAAIEASYHAVFQAWPDQTQQDEGILVDGDRVCRISLGTGTHVHEFAGLPGTGKPFKMHVVWIYQLQGGKIAHEQRLYDFTTLLVQLGVLKVKPAKMETPAATTGFGGHA